MPSTPEAVVNGKKVHKQKGLNKAVNGRYSKHLVVALLFAVVGITGFLFASAATTTSSLWSNSSVPTNITDPDTQSVELGVKFQSTKAGKVTGVKFYKGAQNTGTHTGSLWDTQGNQLATVTFTNETASGWQTANFPAPVNIASGTTYIISYHAPKGHYSGDNNYFAAAHTNGILTAPANTSGSPNGVYSYGSGVTFPHSTFKATNYWVDVIVQTDLIGSTAAPAPPTQVSAIQKDATVVVSWNVGTSPTPITKYRIYKNNHYLLAVGAKQLSYTDSAVTVGSTYSYQIKTVDSNGVGSVRSIAATITVTPVVPPPTTCPVGTTGTYPNCTVIPTCPVGTTGTPPNCVTVTTTGPGNCALTIAGKSCWAANTGVAKASGGRWTEAQILNGLSPLVHTVGNRDIRVDGTVIDNQWIDGCLSIHANNVTVRNSYIRTQNWCYGGNNQAGASAINTGNCDGGTGTITNFNITDSEVSIGNLPQGGNSYSTLNGCNYTATRVNLHGGPVIVWIGFNSKMYDSYVHDPSTTSGTDHIDAVDGDSTQNIVMNHNYISLSPNTGYATGALSLNNSWGPVKNAVVTNNFLEGMSGADVNFGGGVSAARPWGNAQNVTFTGNRLSPNTGWGNLFSYGWDSSNPGMVWSNNLQSEDLHVLAPNGS